MNPEDEAGSNNEGADASTDSLIADPESAEIVKLRFFVGLSMEVVAELLEATGALSPDVGPSPKPGSHSARRHFPTPILMRIGQISF